MKQSDLAEVLEVAIEDGDNLLIVGSPGIGKTDLVSQACSRLGVDLILTHPVTADETVYRGLPFAEPDAEYARWLPYGDLHRLMKAKKKTVFFLDDLGQAKQEVQAAIMQLLLSGSINGHRIDRSLVSFIACTNRPEDMAGVKMILEPVKSRFVIINLEVDVDDWCDWALRDGLPSELISFIRFRPELLHNFTPSNTIENSPNPRNVAICGKIQQGRYPRHNWLELFTGKCGRGWAIEYLGFLKTAGDLPSPTHVIREPDKVPIPEEPATCYALTAAVAAHATPRNCARVVKFANRLSMEYAVRMMKDAALRVPRITETKAFIAWSVKNQHLVGLS